MKYLEYTPLASLNAFLRDVDVGDSIVQGLLEAYSCKVAGVDKKLSRSLDQDVVEALQLSASGLSTSPVGPLSSTASRRTLIYLILTLNHMYPDYDFRILVNVKSLCLSMDSLVYCAFARLVSLSGPQHFCNVHGHLAAKQKVDSYLFETSKIWYEKFGKEQDFLDSLWNAIDEVIGLEECDVYSYMPESEGNPFADNGSIWNFNFFFYNKKLKRMLYFSCNCLSKLTLEDSNEHSEDEDDEFLESMELMDE